MRALAFASASGLALLAAAPVAADEFDAVNVRLERVVGVVDIQPADVDRVSVEFEPGRDIVDAPEFDVRGDTVEVSQLRRGARINCRSRFNDDTRIEVDRDGLHPIADYGRYVVRIPEGARVEIALGAVEGVIGDVGEVSVGVRSCGDITIGDVAGDAELAVDGSGDLEAGTIGGTLSAAINGSGDITTGSVAGGVEAAINGSGDITIAEAFGDVEAAIHGSGDIRIEAGEIDSLEAAIMGSGDVRFAGVARDVELASFGSGDVHVAEVTGRSESRAFGSGSVRIGRRD